MDKEKNKLLTQNQLIFLLIGFAIGPGFLRLPNALVDTAKQDAWISAILGLIYPLYVVLIGSYIINKHPKENILRLSKRYFGNALGSILNFIFMLQFILYTATITSDFINLTRTYIVAFLSPLKVIIIGISIAVYGAYKGLKVLGKTSELISYVFILTLLFSISALKYDDILNVQPVFGSGLLNILKTTKATFYFYTGWEALLLFHPLVENTKAIKKSALKAVGIAGTIWVWTVFVTIYYLGIDIIPKSYWSFVMVFGSIRIPIVNNFRYIFMFVWVLIIFRITANYYFAVAFNLNDLTKIDIKKLCFLIYPFIVYLSLKLSNTILKESILAFASPTFVTFNLIFISTIALLILIKPKLTVDSKHQN